MDNFKIDITSDGREGFDLAMQIAFQGRIKAIGWKEVADKGIMLYWTKADGINLLPVPLDAAGSSDLVWLWLGGQDYGKEPDHDGSNGRGWRIYNEQWRRVNNEWEAFIAIKPAWAMYGK